MPALQAMVTPVAATADSRMARRVRTASPSVRRSPSLGRKATTRAPSVALLQAHSKTVPSHWADVADPAVSGEQRHRSGMTTRPTGQVGCPPGPTSDVPRLAGTAAAGCPSGTGGGDV